MTDTCRQHPAASRVVLGLGGSATNDAGAGMLAALGHRVVTVPGDPANLHVATAEDLAVVRRLTR